MKNEETIIEKQVQHQEADYCGHYRLANLFSELADLATKNAIQTGIWKDEFEQRYGWILIKQTLKMQRPVKINEIMFLSTRASTSSRIQFIRQYDILDINKQAIGGVYSVWTLMDLKKRRIIRPSSIGMKIPDIEEYPHVVESYNEVRRDIEVSCSMQRTVSYSDVDVNQHMNNYRYIEWAMDVFDYNIFKEYYISELSMSYKKEMAPNTKASIKYGKEGNYVKVVITSVDDTITYFELGAIVVPYK